MIALRLNRRTSARLANHVEKHGWPKNVFAGLMAVASLFAFLMLASPAEAGGSTRSTPDVAGTCSSSFTAGSGGIVPASGGGSTNFIRADGVWAAPAGGGSPSGSGTELQYRSGPSSFGAVTGSSVSGGQLTLNDTLFALGGVGGTTPLNVRTNNVDSAGRLAGFGVTGTEYVGIYGLSVSGFGSVKGLMISSATLTIDNIMRMANTVTSLPTCDATSFGTMVFYNKSAANKISFCMCEESAAATYGWFAATSNGNCT